MIPRGAKIYLDKSYVKIYYDSSTCILTSIWKGFTTFDEIKEISKRILEAISIERACKVMYDTSQLEPLDQESADFISTDFTQQMKKAGVKYSAAVIPKDEFAKSSMDEIQKTQISNSNNALYFTSMSKALRWLKKQI